MEIRIECPACKTLYHLPASMAGKSMRCPLGSCRKVFTVELPKPVTLVDLLPGEAVLPPAAPEPPAKPKPAWAEAPPPVRGPVANGTPDADGPTALGPDSWDAPPVRRGKDQNPSPEDRPKRKKPPEVELKPAPPPRNRLAQWIIYPFLVAVLVGLGVGAVMLWRAVAQGEKRLARIADADYKKGLYSSASQKYADVAKRFPDSESRERYDFRARLSEVRSKVQNDPEGLDDLLEDVKQLIIDHDKKAILSEHAGDIGEALVKLLVDFAKRGLEDPDSAKALAELKEGKVEHVVQMARNIKPAPDTAPIPWADIDEAMRKLEQKAELARQRKRVLDLLAELVKEPGFASLRQAERLIEAEKQALPELATSDDVRSAFEAIYRGHLASVRYVREGIAAPPVEADDEPSLLAGPLLAGTPGAGGGGTALALARGVLYGLDQGNGRIRWARRVGIDTTTLPVRVPAGFGNDERVLALSSDTATLAALDPGDGTALWQYKLGTPVLGRPAVIGRRAYLATYSGEVHEIELAEGRLLGRYLLGHRLTAGPTHEAGTNRLYVPADDGCVYVLRVGADPGCELILYTRHPAASLRGEPVVVPARGDAGGYLILNQTAGLRATDLKVYDLPLTDRHAQPRVLKPRAEMDGWTWFPPYADPEKLVMLTDDGMLGAFGIKQSGTNDQALFPLLPEGGLRLAKLNGGEAGTRGRSAVVQVQGSDYWTLALGRLQRLRLVWDGLEGPKLVPVWRDAPLLGSPLHEGQSVDGGSRLVVVTQPPGRSTCWATCVSSGRGEVRWRRQLGLVCRGEPVSVTMPAGGPMLLTQDHGGAMFAIDPGRFKVGKGERWVSAGNMVPLAGSLDDNPAWPPVTLTADGKTFYVVANPGGGKDLVIRKVTPGAGRSLVVQERTVPLIGPVAGPPALVGDFLVVALDDTDGTLVRVPLSGGPVDEGPNWRLARAAADAPGFVLGLGDDRLVTTDGGRGLTVWKWPAGMPQVVLPPGRDAPTLELPGRAISGPVPVPGPDVRFAVADPQGLSLIAVEADGSLTVKRRWAAMGLSAGPYVIHTPAGVRLGAVVGRSRLMWIDPEKADPLWTHSRDGGAEIIGTPYLHAGRILIADQGGRYVGLKVEDGTPAAPGHELRGSIAPAAGVVGFNGDRLLCPLTDGTLLLLDAKKLMK